MSKSIAKDSNPGGKNFAVGTVKRESGTGRFISVQGSKGESRSSPKSQESVKDAASRRHEALKRLADR